MFVFAFVLLCYFCFIFYVLATVEEKQWMPKLDLEGWARGIVLFLQSEILLLFFLDYR